MALIFVDTAALIALSNKQDNWHSQAVIVSRQLTLIGCHFITTDAILLEVGNTFSRVCYKPLALRLIKMVRASPLWQCVEIDNELFNKSLHLFEKMRDKDWSLTDCISINLANQLNIRQIFTSDHHFTQAGFEILLSIKEF